MKKTQKQEPATAESVFAAKAVMHEEESQRWKERCFALLRQCEFALGRLKADGWTGILLDTSGDDFKQIHWKDEMADVMETIPGVRVRRDEMHKARKTNKKPSKK